MLGFEPQICWCHATATLPTAPKPLLKMITFCGPLTGTIKQILHPYITEEITKKNSQNIT